MRSTLLLLLVFPAFVQAQSFHSQLEFSGYKVHGGSVTKATDGRYLVGLSVPCAYTMWAELDPSGNLIVEHGITSSTVSGPYISPEGVLNIFEDQGRITVVNSGFSSPQNNRWYYNINRYDAAGTIIYSTYYDSEDEWGANGIQADRDLSCFN